MTFVITIVMISLFHFFPVSAHEIDDIREIPVQSGGRVKPYDSFAREALQLIYGRQSYQGRPAFEIVTTWILAPSLWNTIPFVQVSNEHLKLALKLDIKKNFFSPDELMANERIGVVLQSVENKLALKDKLSPYLKAGERLGSQLALYRSITAGMALRIYPHLAIPSDKKPEASTWLSVRDLTGEVAGELRSILSTFIGTLKDFPKTESDVLETSKQRIKKFTAGARRQNPAVYPSRTEMLIETTYNRLEPFLWSWILYLLGILIYLLFWLKGSVEFRYWRWVIALGFLVHTLGFIFRSYIAGRPPVSNMYESMIWVSWGAVLFSFIVEYQTRIKGILLAGAMGAALCLIIANLAPNILDPSIQPLEAVLVSNFWLTTHVLTIAISYSAFLLAFVLGNVGLFYYIRGAKKYKNQITAISQAIYRSFQIGVVLLAAGTILGGVWADYSWGRFWGWDPKEAWALIALIGYLVVLHARKGGHLKDFGLQVGAVLSFSLIVMAWYGVNFVLGEGKHSYGFGVGGVEYVATAIGVEIVYIIYAVHRSQNFWKLPRFFRDAAQRKNEI